MSESTSDDVILNFVSGLIERRIQIDTATTTDLWSLLRASPSPVTSSGFSENDYPLSAYGSVLAQVPQLSNLKRVPIPPELVEKFKDMQWCCSMGVATEITRAWLVIDSDIHFWNYEDGGDVYTFDGLQETILCAQIVSPKPGVFREHVNHLLCVATTLDILLLAIIINRPGDFNQSYGVVEGSELHIPPEILFSVPTDNTPVLCIKGTQLGRIFLGAKDGCLYEIAYQASDGWFSKNVKKINHSKSFLSYLMPSFLNFSEDDPIVQIEVDDSRNILYTRSEKGNLTVYDMGADGWSLFRVTAISQKSIQTSASYSVSSIDKSNFKSIVHISVITKFESVNIQLVAITGTGVRLYFTVLPFNSPQSRPSHMHLVHVRLPPGFAVNGPPQKPTNVHQAHYQKGLLVLSSSKSDETNAMWLLSNDSFPFHLELKETFLLREIDGRSWVIAESPTPPSPYQYHSCSQLFIDPPTVVTQNLLPPRRLILLTPQGSHIWTKLRPVDQLKQLFLHAQTSESQLVHDFFKLYREEEACAMCLMIACSNADPQLSEWATRAFFHYGGLPSINFTSDAAMSAVSPTMVNNTSIVAGSNDVAANVLTPDRRFQPGQISTPRQFASGNSSSIFETSVSPSGPTLRYSAKHEGLCIYIARILGPLWNGRIVTPAPLAEDGKPPPLTSSLSSDDLSWFVEQLMQLRQFLLRNSQFVAPLQRDGHLPTQNLNQRMLNFIKPALPGDNSPFQDQLRRKYQGEAQIEERASFLNIQKFIERCLEFIHLWKIICEHQFHVIAATVTMDKQDELKMMTFQAFFIKGKLIAGALISGLINCYLDDHATTDAISNRLRDVCPTLYSKDDALISKATELLQSSKALPSRSEREKVIAESIKLFKQVSGVIQLEPICEQLAEVGAYLGIVDLCLTAAERRDAARFALQFYHNGEPAEDRQGLTAFTIRRACYIPILRALEQLSKCAEDKSREPSVPKAPGPFSPQKGHHLSSEEARQLSELMICAGLQSSDEVFHATFYDWHFEQGFPEKLLRIESPFLESYLRRRAEARPEHLPVLDVLWKYLEKSRQLLSAARVLERIADRASIPLDLLQRLEYLARAVMCAKSAPLSSSQDAEFLQQLEEKLEVARVQLSIFNQLSNLNQGLVTIREARNRLNAELFDLQTLYNEYAHRLNLAESKLAIISCADAYDPALIESLWKGIIDRMLEDCQDLSLESQMTSVGKRFASVGTHYASSEKYFPLYCVLDYLETKAAALQFNPTWVFRTLLSCGMSVTKLLPIYDQLLKLKGSTHVKTIINSVYLMLEYIVENPTMIDVYDRSLVLRLCYDYIKQYIIYIETRLPSHSHEFLPKFRSLEEKLKRLL